MRGAAIAQWIRLRLPSCHPVRVPSTPSMLFFNLYLSFELECEKNENKQKRGWDWPFKKKKYKHDEIGSLELNCFLYL